VRKVLSFSVAAALLAGGIYLLIAHTFAGGTVYGKVLIVAGMLIGVGGWWLWTDFIGPVLSKHIEE
jgi:hypothetical protein